MNITFSINLSCFAIFHIDGKALLKFRQESPGEHVENNEVLKALGLPEDADGNQDQPKMVCDDQACAMPEKE